MSYEMESFVYIPNSTTNCANSTTNGDCNEIYTKEEKSKRLSGKDSFFATFRTNIDRLTLRKFRRSRSTSNKISVDEGIQSLDYIFISNNESTNPSQTIEKIADPEEFAEEKQTVTTEFVNYNIQTENDLLFQIPDITKIGIQIEELYENFMINISHNKNLEAFNIGFNNNSKILQSELFQYLQKAFKISNEKQNIILEKIKNTNSPELCFCVEIIRAINLTRKESMQPFVMLHLESNSEQIYKTSLKSATANPIWQEIFYLRMPQYLSNEILSVSVWIANDIQKLDRNMSKLHFCKMKKISNVGYLLKDSGENASIEQYAYKKLGHATFPIRNVPINGIQTWCNLEKLSKPNSRGLLQIRMNYCLEQIKEDVMLEHGNLLKVFLFYELDSSKVTKYWWNGKFREEGEMFLEAHAILNNISTFERALAQWSAYSYVHRHYPVSLQIFLSMLDKIGYGLQSYSKNPKYSKIFWNGAKDILFSCYQFIQLLTSDISLKDNRIYWELLNDILNIMSKLYLMEVPDSVELFPRNMYPWLDVAMTDNTFFNIEKVLFCTIQFGIVTYLKKSQFNKFRNISMEKLLECFNENQYFTCLLDPINEFLQNIHIASKLFDKQFAEKLKFRYSEAVYIVYAEELASYARPIVYKICDYIEHISKPEEETQNLLKGLFEVYSKLKEFCTLGSKLCQIVPHSITMYYFWFENSICKYIKQLINVLYVRMEKSINLDLLTPVDDSVKHSSSAVDTMGVLFQVKTSWQQLEWPKKEEAQKFVIRIIKELENICESYNKHFTERIESIMWNSYDKKRFEITKNRCLIINNSDFISKKLYEFKDDLIKEAKVSNLNDISNESEVSVESNFEVAIKTLELNKILFVSKMTDTIKNIFAECIETFQDVDSMNQLIDYLDDSLLILKEQLCESSFKQIFDMLLENICHVFLIFVENDLNKKRPPSFFVNFRSAINTLLGRFGVTNVINDQLNYGKIWKETLKIIDIYSYETSQLIHEYYLERLRIQKEMTDAAHGQLAVKCVFKHTALLLHVMYGRNLKPTDGYDYCDSYVKIRFSPIEEFQNILSYKTHIKKQTVFPDYGEKFTISLTTKQRYSLNNPLIIFSVKEKNTLGKASLCKGECLLSFDDIVGFELDHFVLNLTQPVSSEYIKALEFRSGDKKAREFIKKIVSDSKHL